MGKVRLYGFAASALGPLIGRWRLWQPKLRRTHISVASMKRHARKRRNVRARSAK